jgi:hypothetical protein
MPVMLDQALAARFAALALGCVHREYPNKIAHSLGSDADVKPPRELTPVFYGCYDWHSAVHGHWLLVRLLRLFPQRPLAARAETALLESFAKDKVEGELAYLKAPGREGFERPYGLAWLLQLMTELREWNDPRARAWAATLGPLEALAAERFRTWLPKLVYPIRSGTHNQSAFGFSLALDWARIAGDTDLETSLVQKALDFHESDRNCPLCYEPSGEDFLSPCLQTADLMRRVLDQERFAAWLSDYLPDLPLDGSADWLAPGLVHDPADGKLVHLDGLNLSRAWNLKAIAAALPTGDARAPALEAAAACHAQAGLAAVSDAHYEGSHWLASFAVYLTSGRSLEAPAVS